MGDRVKDARKNYDQCVYCGRYSTDAHRTNSVMGSLCIDADSCLKEHERVRASGGIPYVRRHDGR